MAKKTAFYMRKAKNHMRKMRREKRTVQHLANCKIRFEERLKREADKDAK